MVSTRKNGKRGSRLPLPLPLLMGFAVGFTFVYTCRLLTDYEDGTRRTTTTTTSRARIGNPRRFYRANEPSSSSSSLSSARNHLACVAFVDRVDSSLMQRNVWLDRCDRTVYVSERQCRYLGPVVTETFSVDPWTFYCRTLVYLDANLDRGYQWIFLAKDDLWVVYENLMRLVSSLTDASGRDYYAGHYRADGMLCTDAGVLLSADVLTALARLLDSTDACNAKVSDGGESRTLDYHLRKLNGSVAVSNTDSYGCSLFNPISLFEAFDVNGPTAPKTCFSRSAISFRFHSYLKYSMFYKYVLYHIRLANRGDLMSNNILPPKYSDDDIWWTEAQYELKTDPRNMSQTEFNRLWSQIHQIIL